MNILIAIAILFSLTGAIAHVPDGTVFAAYEFSNDQVPEMDGDLSDWELVPQSYFLDLQHHEEVHAKLFDAHDTTDLHIRRVAVGWNDTHNRLYFMAEVYDDVVRYEKENTDSLDTWYSRYNGAYVHGADIWEIVIDADHGGELVVNHTDDRNEAVEMRKRSAYTQNYHFYMPPLNGDYWHWLWGKALWTKDEAYSDVGWTLRGDGHGSPGEITYETYLTPFDDLHYAGPDSSVVHQLEAGEIIGLSWAFLDADDSPTTFDTFWSLSKDREMKMYCMGEYLVDFVLTPRPGDPVSSAE
ncbi:MAG: hypothetical protein VX733_14290 [Candidatus Latescibacterota bacterium]|nr:hypothetical protein [Candidatus Latescibacterota bacterium]